MTPYCGDRDAATVASTENDAMDIVFLESFFPDRFVIRCGTCEDHSVGNAMARQMGESNRPGRRAVHGGGHARAEPDMPGLRHGRR